MEAPEEKEVVRGRKRSRYFWQWRSRSVCRSVGNLGQMLLPFFIAAFKSDLANGRTRKRRQVTRNHNAFCFFHLNRLSHPFSLLPPSAPHPRPESGRPHLGRNKSASGEREGEYGCEKGGTVCVPLRGLPYMTSEQKGGRARGSRNAQREMLHSCGQTV